MSNSIVDLEKAPVLLLLGSNTTEAHPVIGARIRRAVRRGQKLIVVDPRKTDLAERATLWLRPRVGTDITLLNAMAHVILTEGLVRREFMERAVTGLEEFQASVADVTPERAAEVTGVPAEDIRAAARMFATSERAAAGYCLGLTEHRGGTGNVLATANLVLLTGNVGREGAGVNPLRGQNNVQGVCDMGALPNLFPGYQPVGDEEVRAVFAEAWGVEIAEEPGLRKPEVIEGIMDGQVQALYIMGENSLLSEANANHVRQALEKVPFLVVQDLFLTETAALADVVFPAASWGETDGTFTNTERRVQRVRPALDPQGARQDWRIIQELAVRMGYAMHYRSSEEVWEEIRSLAPILAGVTYDRISEVGLQWPVYHEEHPGTCFLHGDLWEDGGGKRARLTPVKPYEYPEDLDEEFPLVLSTGRRLYHYHTGTQTRHARGLEAVMGEEYLDISPADASRYGITDGHRVQVASRRGRVEVKARVTDRMPPGTVFMSFHFHESPTNQLTNDAFDPQAGTPGFKYSAVRVSPLGGEVR